MCCDGTLYSYATLLDDDEGRTLDPTLEIIVRNQQPSFNLPCRFHTGTGCSRYSTRPDTCSRYYCALLRALQRDDVTEFEALAIIAEAKALVENVKEYVQLEPGAPLAVSTWGEAPEDASPEGRDAWDRARNWLRKHLLGPEIAPLEDRPGETNSAPLRTQPLVQLTFQRPGAAASKPERPQGLADRSLP